MVPLGLGQAILGGLSADISEFDYETVDISAKDYQKKIYFMTCFNHSCTVTPLSKELAYPQSFFVAIPIPDLTARCISKGTMFNLRLNVLAMYL